MLRLAQWGWLQIAVYFVMFNKYVRQYGHCVTVFRKTLCNHYATLMIISLTYFDIDQQLILTLAFASV